ncbi:MAG: hypothetical protein DIU68_018995 [Chloroflexota bacterium]|nr:MAG: hypothetical protein DIU68_11660 [Chloroflexota bacterium]
MAIDYVVDYSCVPKETLGTGGILERLKGRARAQTIIRLFREHGDPRPPSEMGFEFTRNTPEGEEETQIVVVQDLLDSAAELDPLAHHCAGCPANVTGEPFGCISFIQYPISTAGEVWLLKQLPTPEEPLPWLLLRQTVTEMGYKGHSVQALRGTGTYFKEPHGFARNLGEFQVTTDQLFEMMFMLGHVQPAHAGALLLFLNAIPRHGEANDVTLVLDRALPADALRERFPFQHSADDRDDSTIIELKRFLKALYYAWSLNVRLLLDV